MDFVCGDIKSYFNCRPDEAADSIREKLKHQILDEAVAESEANRSCYAGGDGALAWGSKGG